MLLTNDSVKNRVKTPRRLRPCQLLCEPSILRSVSRGFYPGASCQHTVTVSVELPRCCNSKAASGQATLVPLHRGLPKRIVTSTSPQTKVLAQFWHIHASVHRPPNLGSVWAEQRHVGTGLAIIAVDVTHIEQPFQAVGNGRQTDNR